MMIIDNKRVEKLINDQELIGLFTSHLSDLGFESRVDNFNDEKGARRGFGVGVRIESIGKTVRLILNHGRSGVISLTDKLEMKEGEICLVISPSEKNFIGYVSRGVEIENLDGVIERSGGKGWNRRLLVEELGFINLKKWLVNG